MRPAASTIALLCGVASALGACTSLKTAPDDGPEGVLCRTFVDGGGDSARLAEALATATPGDCVIAQPVVYRGTFDVPQGVTLAGRKGERPTLEGGATNAAAVSISGGKGSGLVNLAIRDVAGIGIRILGGPVVVQDVTVERAAGAAIQATCASCADAEASSFVDVTVRESKLGAWFQGARVSWRGGASSANRSTSLSGGAGILVTEGAVLEMEGVTVAQNESVGILVDGGGGARVTLKSVNVTDNGERGLWAQNVTGTTDAPGLLVTGQSTFEGNGLVGLGATESTGIVLDGVSLRGTRLRPTLVGISQEKVGDGILLDASGGVVRDVVLEGNERAAALVARPRADVSFERTKVTAGPSGFRIVVQERTASAVSVPAADVSDPGKPLAVLPAVALGSLTR